MMASVSLVIPRRIPPPHGQRRRYLSGCRCVLCRAANARYVYKRIAAKRESSEAVQVSAEAAQRHVLALAKAGIGTRAIQDACGVRRILIQQIRSGQRQFIRVSTERRILSVDCTLRHARVMVSAKATWKRIGELLEEGFTEPQLARRLGQRSGKLQFGKEWVSAKTEQRVAKLYARIMEES